MPACILWTLHQSDDIFLPIPVYTCIVVISITLDIEELFMPVQLTILLSRLLVTFCIIMVDTRGSALGEESLENIKLAKPIIIGVIVGF